jgi:hypothetical protein
MMAMPVEDYAEIATEALPEGALAEALCPRRRPSQLIILQP